VPLNELTPRNIVFDKLIVAELVKKFPSFNETQKFAAVFACP
jgi:hypothetical protein